MQGRTAFKQTQEVCLQLLSGTGQVWQSGSSKATSVVFIALLAGAKLCSLCMATISMPQSSIDQHCQGDGLTIVNLAF